MQSSEDPPIVRTHVRLQANANDASGRRRRPDDRLRHARRVRAGARWENRSELRDPPPSPGPHSLLGAAAARRRSSLRPRVQALRLLGPGAPGGRLEGGAAVRVASRASRGGPGRLWPPRDARDVREIQGSPQGRDEVRTSVTGRIGEVSQNAVLVTKTPRMGRSAWRVAGNATGPHGFRDGDPGPKTRW